MLDYRIFYYNDYNYHPLTLVVGFIVIVYSFYYFVSSF